MSRIAQYFSRFILEETNEKLSCSVLCARSKAGGRGLWLYLDGQSFFEFSLGAVDAEQLSL